MPLCSDFSGMQLKSRHMLALRPMYDVKQLVAPNPDDGIDGYDRNALIFCVDGYYKMDRWNQASSNLWI
jgi:hypothetical protein